MKAILSTVFFLLSSLYANAQSKEHMLLGTLNNNRSCYDVHHYNLDLAIDFDQKSIAGSSTLSFIGLSKEKQIQIDLHPSMSISQILLDGQTLNFNREERAVYIDLKTALIPQKKYALTVYFNGIPPQAKNAPWDGGFVWTKDENGNDWLGVACQGDGASYWWPNKDHLSDEADSATVTCTYPEHLFFVGNGNLFKDKISNGKRTTSWKTKHNINNYNITLNIADYIHFSDIRVLDNDSLNLDYYVLSYNKEKAKEQFRQVKPMLKSFEKRFGPYPFPEDGYALVETSYLGMEHQSAIAYGNKYKKGYLGRYPKDIDFDFIIIHETGHEWWGNSLSMNDRADMWIHESFCTYSEALYVEDIYGYDAMLDYLAYQKNFINNKSPIQGTHGTHQSGNHTDMYYKGSWALHTLRSIVDNDPLWHKSIYDLANTYKRSNLDGIEVIDFMSSKLNLNLNGFFRLYFETTKLPKAKIRKTAGGSRIRIKQLPETLAFPIEVNGIQYEITNRWNKIPIRPEALKNYLERHFLLEF